MKTWQDLKESIHESLRGIYPEEEIASFFKILTEHFLGQYNLSTEQMSSRLSPDVSLLFPTIVERLKIQEPIQYILGYTWFYNLKLAVTPDVLIPRQETEELVHWILQDQQFKMGPKVLDIGTGSGCIALALASYLRSPKVWATDISNEALEVAKNNAQRNEILGLHFRENDILNDIPDLNEKFNIIVSNPPYIKPSDKKIMTENVLNYEPHLALFALDSDPLIFYRAIAEHASKLLLPDGHLYFEINEFLKEELEVLLTEKGYSEIQTKKDLSGNWRMIKCRLSD